MMTLKTYTYIVLVTLHLPNDLPAQSPGGVSTNLSLWMKAESALPATTGVLTSWPDQTGHNTFTRSGSGTSILTVNNIINFHSVVRFSGVASLIGNTSIQWSECTAVASWNGATNIERGAVISPTINGTAPGDASRYFFRAGVEGNPGNYLFSGMGIDSIGFEYITSPPSGQVNLLTASGVNDVFTRNGLDARVGSLFGGFTKRATVMNSPPQIGDRSTNDAKMKGDIAEIIVYSANNAANRNKVESYLALKYGISMGSAATPVNYTSSAGTVFWTGRADYQHNIFGIGADQASGLVQTPSNSMNSGNGGGIGQSAMGNLVLTALSTPANQQFLMIGTDSASLNEETITSGIGPSVALNSKRVIRTWKVQSTNWGTNSVKLSFDITGLTLSGGTTASNYWMLIDLDGDGNYNTGQTAFSVANSVTSNKVTFNGVFLPDNAVFTILTKPSSNAVLAVDWNDFTVSVKQNTAFLQWTFPNDANTDHFAIERSVNATDFTVVGSLKANSDPNSIQYQFREPLPPGHYYYRIRMIRNDRTNICSQIRSLQIVAKGLLQIRSNPIRGNNLQLGIDLPEQNTAKITITDRQGRRILQKEYALQQGYNPVTIDLTGCTNGLYFVQLQAGRDISTLSFLK